MTTTLQYEHAEVLASFDNVEELEAIAARASAEDAEKLRGVACDVLRRVPPVRARTAAHLLSLSERTIRNWVHEGVLTRAQGSHKRLLLDPQRLHMVLHLVGELRAHGTKRAELVEQVWRRLTDQALMDRPDFQESLAQMRQGQVVDA